MNALHILPSQERQPHAVRRTPLPASPTQRALDRARRRLLDLQRPDGHWCGELQGDTILESEYVLLMAFLGRENEERTRKVAEYVLRQQQPDGGWTHYPGGPLELSGSVKAYFALKLTGHAPDASYMRRAREVIRAARRRRPLQQLHQVLSRPSRTISLRQLRSVPPELVLLPRWFYFNLYAMSSWTRTIVVPLSIFSAFKPVRHVAPERGVRELFLQAAGDADDAGALRQAPLSWGNFFLVVDALYKRAERCGLLGPVCKIAVAKAAAWMRQHFADSDGLGAIFPPMIYTVVSLRCLGVADDAPEMHGR